MAEYPEFREGTRVVFNGMAGKQEQKRILTAPATIIGGGDTGTAAELVGVDGKVTFMSTGGGAFLELLQVWVCRGWSP